MTDRKKELLAEINKDLPEGVDWKHGAVTYLDQLFRGPSSESMRRFHLTKPFVTTEKTDENPRNSLVEFSREIAFFSHFIASLPLKSNSSFLDVACGTGWVSHYLAKLGFRAVGIDISQSMIDLAWERITSDPFPTSTGEAFDIDFQVHDIEEGPLPQAELYDFAILESALHHFVDPIQALVNVRKSLKEDGILLIIEGCSDGEDSYCKQIMSTYNTLERPYLPSQLQEILQLAGFPFQQRVVPLSGFYMPGPHTLSSVEDELCKSISWNTFYAGLTKQSVDSLALHGSKAPDSFIVGVDGELCEDIRSPIWIGQTAKVSLNLPGYEYVQIKFTSPIPNHTLKPLLLSIEDNSAATSFETLAVHPASCGEAKAIFVKKLNDGRLDLCINASETRQPHWFENNYDFRHISGHVSVKPLLSNEYEQGRYEQSDYLTRAWMGPCSSFQPKVKDNMPVELVFKSPIPLSRLRTQYIYVRDKEMNLIARVKLKPGLSRYSSKRLSLDNIKMGDFLYLQSSEAFSPSWRGADDKRLLSYQITQIPG